MSLIINPYRFGAADSLLTDLVSWWSLDEASGNRADSHGSFDLTDNNTVTSTTGKQGDAALFAVANDEYLSHVDDADFTLGDRDFTVCAWAQFSSSTEVDAPIISHGAVVSTPTDWLVARNGANQSIRIRVRNAAGTLVNSSSIAITYNTWFFVLFQYDSSTDTASVEVNRGTPVTLSVVGGSHNDSVPLYIGGTNQGNRNLDGAVDEAAIWHRLLTTDEKDRLYNSGSGMAYPG